MGSNTKKSTDDIIQEALIEHNVKKLKDYEKILIQRMQPNQTYLGARVDATISEIERRINHHYLRINTFINGLIASATILTLVSTVVFWYWQVSNIR